MKARRPPVDLLATLPHPDAITRRLTELDAEAQALRRLLRVCLWLSRRPASAAGAASGREGVQIRGLVSVRDGRL